jgi:hypothetical protein
MNTDQLPRRSTRAFSWLLVLLGWAAWPLVLAPLTILLHEIAHLGAAIAPGFPDPVLHFSFISHGDVSSRPGWQSGVVGLAGPVVTALLLLAGLGLTVRRPSARFGQALAVAAASRFFVGVPYTIANIIALASDRQLAPPAFDEYKAGEALGWSGDLTLGVTASLFFLVIIVLLARLPRGERVWAWMGLIGGTVAGWAAGFSLAPLLLP